MQPHEPSTRFAGWPSAAYPRLVGLEKRERREQRCSFWLTLPYLLLTFPVLAVDGLFVRLKSSRMGELLSLRLGAVTLILAAFGGLTFLVLRYGLAALERAGKLPPTADPSHRSLRTDLAFMLLMPITDVLSKLSTSIAIVGCALLIGQEIGPQLLEGFGPVAKQPRWLILIEMLVLSDFIYYWVHRSAHTFPQLWRFHAVHHSSRHLRWTSALRAHPVEIYLHVITLVPLFFIGFPVDALVPLVPITTLYACIIHSNANLYVRRLSYVMNSPRYHAWHHNREVGGGIGTNFAGYFPVFDAIFGTYQLPDQPPALLGIDDENMPETCVAQLEYPFRRSNAAPADQLNTEARDSSKPSPFVPGQVAH